ncbi:MAG: RNA pseudouridine synthase, partial [Gammaproteobacteria bacterium]|nr:RNA pseudouridine synthase [Gammaproteobacteria bacterium]
MTRDNLNPEHFEVHIKASVAGQAALDLLAENAPVSKQKIKKAMQNGAAWLESSNGIHRLRRAKKQLGENDFVHLYYDAAIQGCTPAAAELIADAGEYSIWHKPYGMYSQG